MEFYSSGNIILTDCDYKILSLLRTVSVEEENKTNNKNDKNEKTRFAVGEIYDITSAKTHNPVTMKDLKEALRPNPEKNEEKDDLNTINENVDNFVTIELVSSTQNNTKKGNKKRNVNLNDNQNKERDQKIPLTKKEKKRLKELKLKQQEQEQKENQKQNEKNNNKKRKEVTQKNITLARWIKEKFAERYGPNLVEHILKETTLDPNLKILTDIDISEDSPQMKCLLKAFQQADEIVQTIHSTSNQGYIISHKIKKQGVTLNSNKKLNTLEKNESKTDDDESKENKEEKEEKEDNEIVIYDEFHPYLFSQFKDRMKDVLVFPSFNEAVDEYYSKMEEQQLELKQKNTENMAQKKIGKC